MLTPMVIPEEEIAELEIQQVEEPSSKTWKLDFETGEILPVFIDYGEAIRQFVVKSIRTIREEFLIYSSDYGCEIFDVLGQSYSLDYLMLEIPRLIEEAVLHDDRVEELVDFDIVQIGDEVNISFRVVAITGDILETIEVSL